MSIKLETLEKLVSGFSNQSKIANYNWIILAGISIITLTTITNKEILPVINGVYTISMPFNLGTVNYNDFLVVCVFLLAALIIGFSSPYLQAQRVKKLVLHELNSLEGDEKFKDNIPLRDFWEIWELPMYGKVYPIVHYFDIGNKGKIRKFGSKFTYFLFKMMSFLIIFFLPLFAQIVILYELCTLKKFEPIGLLQKFPFLFYVAIYFWFCSTFILILLVVSDVKWIKNALRGK